MSFRILDKGEFGLKEALPEGFCSIDRGGTVRFHKEDLALVGIEDVAVLLTDELTLRIAIRRPKPNEGRQAYRIAPAMWGGKKGGKDLGRRQLLLKRALREIRIDPEAAAGRYELTTKDDMLIISLAGIEERSAEQE